ncbi:MAG TPA: aminoacyl-tRNA hydrolase [Actinomycetota bacterium]
MPSGTVLVVGLGNPGPEYRHTRHNVGFDVVEVLAERLAARLRPAKGSRAMAGTAKIGDAQVVLATPTTYMNASGEAVAPLARYYKVEAADVIVVQDEIDLPLGQVRVKRGGGDAGHNGLKSITRSLGTRDYVRVRVGVGRPSGPGAVDHVLSAFSTRERAEADIVIREAADVVFSLVREGLEATQERINARARPPKPHPRAIRHDVWVRAAPPEVFRAWTTAEGARTFFAPDARIELTPGGAYEIVFLPDNPPGERGSEGCTVVAFEPDRFLVFTWNAPPSIPTVRAARRKTRVEVRLEREGEGTRVSLAHVGWGKGEDWDEAFAYFERAWDTVLGRLARRFAEGPIDWDAE